jgi:hypothetical protein
MPQYKVIVMSRDATEDEAGLPIQFHANGKLVSLIPGEEAIISETALENLKQRAIFEKPIIKDGILVGKKKIERYPTTIIETIYSPEEKANMKEGKRKTA